MRPPSIFCRLFPGSPISWHRRQGTLGASALDVFLGARAEQVTVYSIWGFRACAKGGGEVGSSAMSWLIYLCQRPWVQTSVTLSQSDLWGPQMADLGSPGSLAEWQFSEGRHE